MRTPYIPHITYEIAPLDMEADLFYSFSKYHRERWGSVLDRAYPELRTILADSKNEVEAKSRCKEFAQKMHAYNKESMETGKVQLQKAWNAIGPDFLTTLSEHFETEWPAEHPAIVGYVSVQPVFPRFLKTFSFCVGYTDLSSMIENSAHEILHFLWFKKWSEVFPDMSPEVYESPHLVWRLSEIMDPIILQCHPKLRVLIKPQKWGYQSFAKITIDGVSMTDYFRAIYEDSVHSSMPFSEILLVLWDAIQQHEAEVSVS